MISDAEATYRRLEELIVLTELKPGVMYSERALSELVGFGRTPVREALQRLAIEGLVQAQQRRGIQITEADPEAQLRLLEIRRPLQNFAAEYAARRASEEDRERMRVFSGELGVMGETSRGSRAEALYAVRRAHDLMVEACHNEFALKTLRIVQGLSRRFWIFYMHREDFGVAMGLHRDLLREVADGDVGGAIGASDALVDYLELFARERRDWS